MKVLTMRTLVTWNTVRCILSLALAAGVSLAAAATPAFAQPAKKGNIKPKPVDVTRTSERSGIDIKMTYFPSEKGEDAAVVVLLHGKGGNRLVWRKFALKLQEENFAVITVDLSGHGESGSRLPKNTPAVSKKDSGTLRPPEFQAMVGDDLEVVKDYILELHAKQELNATRLAIVGADFSAAVAIAFADFDWQKPRYDDAPDFEERTPRGEDVRALILLSPEDHAPGINLQQACFRLRALGMPVMVGVSKKDKLAGAAKKVYDHFAPKKTGEGDKQYVYLMEYAGQDRGTDLLNREDQRVELNMLAFLQKHLDALEYPWRDRRSRLDLGDGDEETPKKKAK